MDAADRQTIIVVERDYVLACMALRALKPHRVLIASGLEHARAILESTPVHAVVLDPAERDGLDFLIEMATRYRHVRVVAYTMSIEAQRRAAFGTAHAILIKPARDELLREAVLGEAAQARRPASG